MVLADKGYDPKGNPRYIREVMNREIIFMVLTNNNEKDLVIYILNLGFLENHSLIIVK